MRVGSAVRLQRNRFHARESLVLQCFWWCGVTTQDMVEAAEGNEMTLERVRRGLGLVGPDQTFAFVVGCARGVLDYEDLLVAWAAALLRIVELEQLL